MFKAVLSMESGFIGIVPVARFESPFPTKFGIPRQAGLAPGLRGRIVFEPAFRSADALRGLDGFDYLWLIWGFSGNKRAFSFGDASNRSDASLCPAPPETPKSSQGQVLAPPSPLPVPPLTVPRVAWPSLVEASPKDVLAQCYDNSYSERNSEFVSLCPEQPSGLGETFGFSEHFTPLHPRGGLGGAPQRPPMPQRSEDGLRRAGAAGRTDIPDKAPADKTAFRATVRPPRLGGNERIGVFASRSPFRPNPLGLSSVRIESIEYDARDSAGRPLGPVINVLGADLMDGTPIYDIKPYVTYADSIPGHGPVLSTTGDGNPWKSCSLTTPPDAGST